MTSFLAVLALAILFATSIQAQDLGAGPANTAANLDTAKATIDAVEAALARSDLADARLSELRDEVDPIASQMQGVAANLAAPIDAARARIAQLGPKPDPNGPPEPAEISAERAAQEKLFNDLDGTAKRARVLAVQARQIGDGITARRRAAFAQALFTRSTSGLAPTLWMAVARELPVDARVAATLARDGATAALSPLSGTARLGLLALLVGIAGLCWPAWRVAVRLRSRRPDAAPTPFGRSLGALRVTLATAAVPTVAVLAVGAVLAFFDVPNPFDGLGPAAAWAVATVAAVAGLARGYLAPKSPNWRVPAFTDDAAKISYHLVVALVVAFEVERVLEALNDVLAVALPTAVATRALGALAAAAILLHAIGRARAVRRRQTDVKRTLRFEHWVAVTRIVTWTLVVVLLGSVATGFVALSSFIVEQAIVAACVVALLHVALVFVDEGLVRSLASKHAFGRWLAVATGLRAETIDQAAVLAAGLLRVALFAAAALVLLSPWRVGSSDVLATAEAAFFGFSVGDVTISLSAIALSVLLFGVVIAATRAVQGWLESTFLPRTTLDAGLRNAMRTSLGYGGFTLALALALSTLGLSFERLAIVAGALSVGIGFGLQSVVNNFVSGLILLWERAIRVGDWIAVGDEQGYVRRINVRSTEIETFDRALLILPNATLISGQVKNWVRNDRVGRIKIPFVVPLDADPEDVRATLIAAAKAHDLVLAIPAPSVLFTSLGDTNLRFDLLCFTGDVESSARVTSDLLYDAFARFKAKGLVRPPAPPVVTSPALDKLDAWLSAKVPGADPAPSR